MADLKCKNCGGSITFDSSSKTLTCEFCGATQTFSDLLVNKETEFIFDQDSATNAVLNTYRQAVTMMERAQTERSFIIAAELFEEVPALFNAEYLAQECRGKAELIKKEQIYQTALLSMKTILPEPLEHAEKLFESIPNYKDAAAQIDRCRGLMPQAQQNAALKEKEERQREIKEQRIIKKRKKKRFFILSCILFLCLGIFLFGKSLYSRNNIKIIVSPVDDAYLTTDYNDYTFHYDVEIKNNSFFDITALNAEIYFENPNDKVLIDANLNLYNYSIPVVRAKKSTNITWSITMQSQANASELYNSDFEDLDINIDITNITFKDGKRIQY